MQSLRACSSRAVITSSSFTNEYHFGSFKGDADRWMEKYFDAHLYNSHWGTRILMLRLPATVLSLASVTHYCGRHALFAREKAEHVILKFVWHDEDCEKWVQQPQELSALLPLRDHLAQGDLRTLYVGWLLGVQSGEFRDDQMEPPVPGGLGDLKGALGDLVEFLRIDRDLLAAAAETSAANKPASVGPRALAGWLASLPTAEKDALLLSVLEGDSHQTVMEMKARFHREHTARNPSTALPRRTVGQLLRAKEARCEAREQEEAQAARGWKRREAELAAVARRKRLQSLAGRENELWRQVDELIATRQPKHYDSAVQHLVDLRDLAANGPAEVEFQARLRTLQTIHAAKKSLLDRVRNGGLT